MTPRTLFALSLSWVAACGGATTGSDAGHDGGRVDAGVGDGGAADVGLLDAGTDLGLDAGVDAGSDLGLDAGGDLGIDAGSDLGTDAATSCTDGASCTTNPGAACRLGVVACGDGGPSCVDGAPVADGVACSTDGSCVAGVCTAPMTVSSDLDLSTMTVTPGRTCVEAPQYAATALAGATATVLDAPVGDCLAAGDEVMLINLQGAGSSVVNVGNWELLTVASVTATSVAFTTPKTRFYGAGAADDSGIGTAVTDQKVALIRVPHFGALTVAAGARLTASQWNGATGGVVTFRAVSLQVDGTIDAAMIGYRSGDWSQDSGCVDSLTTQGGESISGVGALTTLRNLGGSGGIGAATGISFNGFNPLNSTPGHAHDGAPGLNGNGRTVGEPGVAYGVDDGTRLTMGSAPSGNVTCTGASTPLRLIAVPGFAGGIVALFVGDLVVSATGAITAAPHDDQNRDLSYAGGYVYVQGDELDVGTALVTARGGTNVAGTVALRGMEPRASDGYVVLDSGGTVTGTTVPAANVLAH